jgi:hypothetical protein
MQNFLLENLPSLTGLSTKRDWTGHSVRLKLYHVFAKLGACKKLSMIFSKIRPLAR